MSSKDSTQACDQAKVSPSSFLPPTSAPGNEATMVICTLVSSSTDRSGDESLLQRVQSNLDYLN